MNGTLSGFVAILMWSLTATLIVMSGNVPGFLLAFLSFFCGFVVITLRQVWKREDIISYWTQPVSNYVFTVCGIGLYTTLLYLSFKWAPPFEANTLNYLWPILLVALVGLVHHKKLSLHIIFGLILGFMGILFLFYPRSGHVFFDNFSWGHGFALCAALIWSVYSVLARKKSYPQGIMAPTFLFSSVLCLGCHLFFEQTYWPQSWLSWSAVILLGVLRISYSFWDYGMKNGNVVLLASLSYFIPLLSTLFLVGFGTRPHDVYIAVGGGLIIIGCLIVNLDSFKKALKEKQATS